MPSRALASVSVRSLSALPLRLPPTCPRTHPESHENPTTLARGLNKAILGFPQAERGGSNPRTGRSSNPASRSRTRYAMLARYSWDPAIDVTPLPTPTPRRTTGFSVLRVGHVSNLKGADAR